MPTRSSLIPLALVAFVFVAGFAVGAVTLGRAVAAPRPQPPQPPRWQYHCTLTKPGTFTGADSWEVLGESGWELSLSYRPAGGQQDVFCFKKRK